MSDPLTDPFSHDQRPTEPVRSRAGRLLRRVAMGVAALMLLVLLTATALPLILRGAVLRYVVERATASLCGTFRIAGGGFAWDATWRLLWGRPVDLTLVELHIMAPDGREVLGAAELSASVHALRHPWRVVISDAHLRRGRWELRSNGRSAPGFAQAWKRVPAGASRAMCLEPASPRAAGRRPRPTAGTPGATADSPPLLAITGLRLEAVDVDLSFAAWGLRLDAVDAHGTLAVGKSFIEFDARNAFAKKGGLLRIGPEERPWGTRVPFDTVAISRVSATDDLPGDLLLEVAAAITGRSRLAGRAVFVGVFPTRGKSSPSTSNRTPTPAPKRTLPPAPTPASTSSRGPGLDLDARWENGGDAWSRLQGGWIPRGPPGASVDPELTIILRGPFSALAGVLRISAARALLTARLAATGWLDTDLTIDGADTAGFISAALRPLLGGRLTGALSFRLQMAPTLAGMIAEVGAADLHLRRDRLGPFPRHFRLRIAQPAHARARGATPPDETVAVALAGARFAESTLRLVNIDATWASSRARGSVVANAAGTDVDARFAVTVGSLARLLPGLPVKGFSKFTLEMRGQANLMKARVRFAANPLVSFWDETFKLPATVMASLADGEVLTVADFTAARIGGGTVTAGGRLVFDGPVAADVNVRDYPLQAIPGLHSLPLPPALAAGQRGAATVGQQLGGRLSGALALRGSLAAPTVQGHVELRDVTLGGRKIGDGDLALRARPAHVAFQGSLGPTVRFDGAAKVGAGVPSAASGKPGQSVWGETRIDVQGLRLGPWLPRQWASLDPTVTGRITASLNQAATPALRGSLRVIGGGVGGGGGGINDLELEALLDGDQVGGRLRGAIDVATLRPAWAPWFDAAAGSVELDLRLPPGPFAGQSLSAPALADRLRGHVTIGRDVVLRDAAWPSPVVLEAKSRLDIDGLHFRANPLTLSANRSLTRATLAGSIRLDAAKPPASTLDLSMSAHLDATALTPTLASVGVPSGQVAATGNVTGTVGRPMIDARATIDLGLQLRPRPGLAAPPALRMVGTVKARGDTVSTTGLRLAIARVGELTVGSAAHPATLQMLGLSNALGPLRLGRVDAALVGQRLTVGDDLIPLSLGQLDVALNLTGRFDGDLALGGEVGVKGAKYDPQRATPQRPRRASTGRWYQALPPRFTLDLTLRGSAGGVTVAVPYLPDVTADFECRLIATARGASLRGRLGGDALYSKAAITLYDWMQPNSIRQCQFLKP